MINKNTENRDKWFARFMCVLIACCLWLYVMSEQNPIVEKEFACSYDHFDHKKRK